MNSGMYSSADATWTTPRDFFDLVDAEFGFVLDAAALAASALCVEWYGPDHPDPERRDALVRDWAVDSGGRPVWLNPPYGRVIKQWVAKAEETMSRGGVVVCLVPARTDTAWWHDHCINKQVRYLRGRLKFGNQKNSAPFPSAVVVMDGR